MRHKHTFKHAGNGTFKCSRCNYTWVGVGMYLRRIVLDPTVRFNVEAYVNPTRGGMSHRLVIVPVKARSNA